MVWSVLQSAHNTSGLGSATLAVTMGSNTTSGSKLISYIAWGSTTAYTITSVEDQSSNALTLMAGVAGTVGGNDTGVAIYAYDSPTSGIKPVITVTFSNSAVSPSMVVEEVSGLMVGSTTSILDGSASTTQNSTSPATPAAYSSGANNEFLVSLYGDQGNSVTWTTPSGYTADTNAYNASGNADLAPCYKNSTGGAETGAFTLSGSVGYGVIMVAFRLPASTANTFTGYTSVPGIAVPGLFTAGNPGPAPAPPAIVSNNPPSSNWWPVTRSSYY